MTIHSDHPFRDATDEVRRLRGRVGATVTLWTAGSLGSSAAGLTVSSYAVVTGDPGRIVGVLDPDSDLVAAMRETGRAVVQMLTFRKREVSDVFGGQLPSPGGQFTVDEFEQTPYGPRLVGIGTWAHCRLEAEQSLGWSLLATLVIDELGVGEEADLLVHRRGRYVSPGS